MIASIAFATYAVVAIGLLWLMKPVQSNFLDGLLLRAASAFALLAGFVGAGGVLGEWINSLIGMFNDTSARLFGGTILGIIGLLVGIWIILMWLPSRYYDNALNQTAVIICFFVPSLVGQFPGPIGHGVAQILHAMANLAGSFFGTVTT